MVHALINFPDQFSHDADDLAGFNAFRSQQEAAVTAAVTGRDCLVLMPTGGMMGYCSPYSLARQCLLFPKAACIALSGGKSLCYSLTALATGRLVLVVSPLIGTPVSR